MARKSMAKRIKQARGNVGEPFNVGSSVCRWVEDPEAIGLVRLGYCDEVSHDAGHYGAIRHRGWFLDPDDQDEVARGVVFRLAGRAAHRRLFAGFANTTRWKPERGEEDAAVVCFEPIEFDDELGASYAADCLAERAAEAERNYREASSARLRYEELAEEVTDKRRICLGLLRDIKRARATLCDHQAICAALRERVDQYLDLFRKLRAKRAKLRDEYSKHEGWENY